MSKILDIQYMDMNYDRYYLVPWPDFQEFMELDEEQTYVIPATVDNSPVCFVDADWIGRGCPTEEEDDL